MTFSDRERRIQTVCLLILAAVATCGALYWLRPVIVPFVLSLFFAILLSPLIDLQQKHLKASRAVALATTLILGMGLFALLGVLITASVSQMASEKDAYVAKIEELQGKAAGILPFDVPGLDGAGSSEGEAEAGGDDPEAAAEPDMFDKAVQSAVVSTVGMAVGVVSQGILVAIFAIFLLIGEARSQDQLPPMWTEIQGRIEVYLATKFFTSATTGILVGVILALLGVQPALVFGLFAFLLNFIPNVGSIIATLLPLPVVLVDPEMSWPVATMAILIPGLIQFGVGNLLEPKMMGSSLDLHPITILIALVFWGALWGGVGMLLATPMTAVVKMLLERLEHTRPVADALAGRFRGGGD